MSHENFVAALALIGLVILVASLLSGAVERLGLPQVAIFLLFGAVLGPAGLSLFDLPIESETVEVIATLALLLVLFTDAIRVDPAEVREHGRLSVVLLGPGTLLPAALIAVSAWLLLDVPIAAAAILGAGLASTDPVLLSTLVRHPALPPTSRLALRLESGMNDVVLLPIVVLAMLSLQTGGEADGATVGRHIVGLFLLGPLLGLLVGFAAITLLDKVRAVVSVRRDYESIYALGVAFTAFAAAEAVGGSGFLAAFGAGLAIAALDVELCDCFLDYGQATAEMFLLFTFVTFGASIIWTGLEVADFRTLLFAAIALFVRTVVLLPVLAWAGVEARSRRIIAWAGPRGLSTLLLVLLPVFGGIEGAIPLFQIACLVVLASVVLHGGGIAVYLGRSSAGTGGPAGSTPATDPAERPAPASPVTAPAARDRVPERITIPEMQQLREQGERVTVLDVRTERSYRDDPQIAVGAIRMPPDDAVRMARERGLDHHGTLVLYCT
jgi:NhaP-type Na+/H+ or K+/H+ antiporter